MTSAQNATAIKMQIQIIWGDALSSEFVVGTKTTINGELVRSLVMDFPNEKEVNAFLVGVRAACGGNYEIDNHTRIAFI